MYETCNKIFANKSDGKQWKHKHDSAPFVL